MLKICRYGHQGIVFQGTAECPDECPLCRAEGRINEMETELIQLRAENIRLKRYEEKASKGEH